MVGERPVIESTGGLASPNSTIPSDSIYWRCPSLNRMSNPSVDFPEPDSPVKTTSWFFGMERLMFLRLCSRSPRTVISAGIHTPVGKDRGRIVSAAPFILQPTARNLLMLAAEAGKG